MRIRKTLLAVGALASAALLLGGCAANGGGSGSNGNASTGATADSNDSSATGAAPAGGTGEHYKIGILQLVQHPALDAATEGFQQAIKDAGLDAEFDVQNANGDQATAQTIAAKFAGDSGYNLMLAVATPAAQALATAVTDRPIIFAAVTDPVAAKIVKSNDAPGGNVTGMSDMAPVGDQVELITKLKPDAKTIGTVYSSGEVNSKVQIDLAKAKAQELGVELKEATVTNVGEVPTALDSLGDVDALYIPTDNTVVSGIDTVITYANDKKIPVVSGDTGPVEQGATATLGLDYLKSGMQAGDMAVRILTQGADPATMPVETQKEFDLVLNQKAADAIGLTLPQDMIDSAKQVIK